MSTSLQNSELAGTALLDQTRAVWMGRLAQLWNGDARPKFDLFRKQVAGHSDALSYLQEWHAGAGPVCAEIISATIERIQSERFDISDLFAEIRSLDDSLQELAGDSPHALHDCVSYRRALDELFEAVIKETSVVYERFSEIGRHALCILDSDGHVTFANRSASALLAPSGVKGRTFVESLNPASQERIATRIASLRPGEQQYETIEIDDNDGRTRTMSAELTRVPRETPRCCYSVSITPAARFFGFESALILPPEQIIVRVGGES